MRLTRAQRAQLFAGDYSPLIFAPVFKEDDTEADRERKMNRAKPCEAGDKVVIRWERFKQVFDPETKTRAQPEPEPVLWLVITSVTYRARGGWAVRYDVVDRRQRRRLLRKGTPGRTPDEERYDEVHGLTEQQKVDAAEESAYTANPVGAVDHLDAVPRGEQPPELGELQRKQAKLLREAQKGGLSIGRQLDSLLEDARESRLDIRSRARRIEREVELLKEQLRNAA